MRSSAQAKSTIGVAKDAELIALLETLYNSRNPTRRWLHCTRRDWIIAKLRECARIRHGRALEVGFGAGVYLPALCENYREVVATDLDRAHLNHALPLTVKYPNLRVITDDITASRLPKQSFDLALCSEVLEHIPATAQVLAGIRTRLAPGGTLIISTPQRHSLMELACKFAFMPGVISVVRRIYGEAIFETGHVNLMTQRELTSALDAAGFRIRETFRSGMYLPMIAEFTGASGQRFAQWLEHRIRRGPLSWALWTQYYVAEV